MTMPDVAKRRRARASTARRSVGLFTYSTLPRGSVVHTAQLADALVDAGWDATVHALDKDGRGFFRPLRAALHLIPAAPAPPTTAALVRLRAQELARHVLDRASMHDIHHAEDCLSGSGLLAARAQGSVLRVVRTVHHVEQFADPYLDACQTRSIEHADLCLSVSEAARRDVQLAFGVDSVVVGNGVDVARFREVDDQRLAVWRQRRGTDGPVVLAMGGVEPRKNTVRILDAFARLRVDHPRALLWIVGGATVLDHGAYRQQFDIARAALDPATRAAVTEWGVLADAEIPALFRAADVLAMPSTHEGFGLCALEALAAELPVLVSARAPFTEFLDDSCATMVDPFSVEAIVGGLQRVLASATSVAASERRWAGLRRAMRHSWRRVAELHIDQYERTLADARDALHRSLA